MTIRSQLYLLQLEDYHFDRYKEWRRVNSNRDVIEKKGKINWTLKAKILYFLAYATGSIDKAFEIYSPIDQFTHSLLTLAARTKLVLFHRKLITIGVTGSWGKTTTKEQLATILATKFRVAKTNGNHNTILGVAIDVLKIPINTQVFICEMGAYKPGDIREICRLVKPKIGIITAIGSMHLERFGSLENIKKTKEEIWEKIPKDGLKIGPNSDSLQGVAKYFNLDPKLVSETLAKMPTTPHRLEIIKASGVTVIDDSYNSNPAGFERAVHRLREIPGIPKILVTPGMIELGKTQNKENKKAAILSEKVADYIVFVGETNKSSWKKALSKSTSVVWAKNIDNAKEILSKLSKPGAVILFENDLPDHYS